MDMIEKTSLINGNNIITIWFLINSQLNRDGSLKAIILITLYDIDAIIPV